MGYSVYESVAERLRSAAQYICEADLLQTNVATHRLNRLEPLARALEKIAGLLKEGKVSAATAESYRLLVAVDQAAIANLANLERREIARLLGGIRTDRKSKAARKNGVLGGRPRKDRLPLRRASMQKVDAP